MIQNCLVQTLFRQEGSKGSLSVSSLLTFEAVRFVLSAIEEKLLPDYSVTSATQTIVDNDILGCMLDHDHLTVTTSQKGSGPKSLYIISSSIVSHTYLAVSQLMRRLS